VAQAALDELNTRYWGPGRRSMTDDGAIWDCQCNAAMQRLEHLRQKSSSKRRGTGCGPQGSVGAGPIPSPELGSNMRTKQALRCFWELVQMLLCRTTK